MKTMKIEAKYSIPSSEGIERFCPIEGTWSAKFDRETQTCWDAAPVIAEKLESQFGFPVKVELFRRDGHAITDNSNEIADGEMLVTRK